MDWSEQLGPIAVTDPVQRTVRSLASQYASVPAATRPATATALHSATLTESGYSAAFERSSRRGSLRSILHAVQKVRLLIDGVPGAVYI